MCFDSRVEQWPLLALVLWCLSSEPVLAGFLNLLHPLPLPAPVFVRIVIWNVTIWLLKSVSLSHVQRQCINPFQVQLKWPSRSLLIVFWSASSLEAIIVKTDVNFWRIQAEIVQGLGRSHS